MACYFPNHWFEGEVKEKGKVNVVFRLCDSFRGVRLEIPCGKCVGCLMKRAKDWSCRCMHEASMHDRNCFITLTYSDEYLPFNGSLDVYEFSDFMKRLRKRYGAKIRFFSCGEYGPVNLRPHYHALLFNHDFNDKVAFKTTEAGSPIYLSGELMKLWPKGFSSVTDVTLKSASYVARYNLKKVLNPVKLPDNLTKEYLNMSRRPGIGAGWFEKFNGDVYPSDEVVFSGDVRMKPPRFYDILLDRVDPNLLSSTKDRREELAQIGRFHREGGLLVDEQDCFRQAVKEEVFRASIRELKRGSLEV